VTARTAIDYGDIESAFGRAAVRISERFRLHKGGGHAIEPRAVMARFDPSEELLTVWDGTQMPTAVRCSRTS
jgi:carbon-monoxide dehydrogenase large subunit